nr:hypothetical protein [Neorhizobium xiangyangii]
MTVRCRRLPNEIDISANQLMLAVAEECQRRCIAGSNISGLIKKQKGIWNEIEYPLDVM